MNFGYRIFVSVVSCMDLEHGHGNGKKRRSRRRCTEYHEECINTPVGTAIRSSSRFISFEVSFSIFPAQFKLLALAFHFHAIC